jgi:hypothetical protein
VGTGIEITTGVTATTVAGGRADIGHGRCITAGVITVMQAVAGDAGIRVKVAGDAAMAAVVIMSAVAKTITRAAGAGQATVSEMTISTAAMHSEPKLPIRATTGPAHRTGKVVADREMAPGWTVAMVTAGAAETKKAAIE